MKKILAMLLAFGAGSAQAADDDMIKLSVKGSVIENIGYATNIKLNESSAPSSVKLSRLAEQDNGSLSILGKATLDKDVSLAMQGDLYGTASDLTRSVNGACDSNNSRVFTLTPTSRCTSNVTVKRAFATIGSPVGSLILGEREDATYIVHNSAPDVSPLARNGDGYFYYWVVAPANHRNLTVDDDSRYDDRSYKVSYVTPAFNGLTAVLTYVPNLSSSAGSGSPEPATPSDYGLRLPNGRVTGANYGGDAYGGGVFYSNAFRGIGVKADATVVQADVANLRIWQQGVRLTYAGFTVGASSLIRDVPGDATIGSIGSNAAAAALASAGTTAAAIAQAAVFAGNGYTLGLRYAIGPYSVSTAFFHDNSKSLAALNGSGRSDSTDVYDVGVADDMGTMFAGGPRLTLRAGIGYISYKGSVANAATPWANNNSGIVFVTGAKLDF